MKLKNKNLSPKFTKTRKNPYISTYGYHLTNSKNLDNILKHGLKRKIFHKKDNAERWIYNNVLYGGKSPLYFFANLNFMKNASDLLQYTFEQNEADILLKVNVEKFNQLADIPHFLDFVEIFLTCPEPEDYNKCYLEAPDGIEDPVAEKIFTYNTFLTSKKLPLKRFLTDEKLNEDIIFYTETFCIAEDIPAKYIEKVVKI